MRVAYKNHIAEVFIWAGIAVLLLGTLDPSLIIEFPRVMLYLAHILPLVGLKWQLSSARSESA